MPPHADILKWEHLPFPKSLPQFQKLFPDDAACARYLKRVRWPKEFVCPLCQAKGEPYRFTARPHVLRCRACRQDTALTAGTVMERTRTPLTTWFWDKRLIELRTDKPGEKRKTYREIGEILTREFGVERDAHSVQVRMTQLACAPEEEA